MKTQTTRIATIALIVGLSGATVTALADSQVQSRLGGLAVYDVARDLTWVADANLLGRLDWHSAQEQIAALNSSKYLGFDDWRLPDTAVYFDPTCDVTLNNAYGCTGSELGHLFYEVLGGSFTHLGSSPGSSILTDHNENLALFSNVQPDGYWSRTVSLRFPGPFIFRFDTGVQDASVNYDLTYYSWLVRTGDVVSVPEPQAYAMFLAGLGLVGAFARWRRNKR